MCTLADFALFIEYFNIECKDFAFNNFCKLSLYSYLLSNGCRSHMKEIKYCAYCLISFGKERLYSLKASLLDP